MPGSHLLRLTFETSSCGIHSHRWLPSGAQIHDITGASKTRNISPSCQTTNPSALLKVNITNGFTPSSDSHRLILLGHLSGTVSVKYSNVYYHNVWVHGETIPFLYLSSSAAPPTALTAAKSRGPLLRHIHCFCWFSGLRFLGRKDWHVVEEFCLTLFEHMGALRGQLEVCVPTRHFIRRDFFFRRITVKVTVVSGSLDLEKKIIFWCITV